jgi:hypothetical protein
MQTAGLSAPFFVLRPRARVRAPRGVNDDQVVEPCCALLHAGGLGFRVKPSVGAKPGFRGVFLSALMYITGVCFESAVGLRKH